MYPVDRDANRPKPPSTPATRSPSNTQAIYTQITLTLWGK